MIATVERAPATTVSRLSTTSSEPWSLGTRALFRLCFLYFGLYALTIQMLGDLLAIPGVDMPDIGKLPPLRQLILWVGHHVLHVPAVSAVTGSGDTLFDWSQGFTLLVFAVAGALVWSVGTSDTKRHDRLWPWFRVFLRFMLGTTLMHYGMIKLFPLQMPAPSLGRLLQQFGTFSPMGLIWSSIGSAEGYERFIGSAEILAGLLLFLPATALLGGLVALGVTIGVFAVNMTYDVPVKLFSFHLVLMSLIVIGPDIRRLIDVIVLNKATAPSPAPTIGRTPTAKRGWLMVQLAIGAWSVASFAYQSAQRWKNEGTGAPRSALYGIWDVDSMTIDGALHVPLTTDTARFSHAVFQSTSRASFQRMDQSFLRFAAVTDTVAHTITLKKDADSTWTAKLAYHRPSSSRLDLEGDIDGSHVWVRMSLHDLKEFPLVGRGFHWVQEEPFSK
ncbi:MAG: hypothetical protein ABJE47_09025 [bacterium]